jgi:hypothetical protein
VLAGFVLAVGLKRWAAATSAWLSQRTKSSGPESHPARRCYRVKGAAGAAAAGTAGLPLNRPPEAHASDGRSSPIAATVGWLGEMAAVGAEESRCRRRSGRRALPQSDRTGHALVRHRRGCLVARGLVRAERSRSQKRSSGRCSASAGKAGSGREARGARGGRRGGALATDHRFPARPIGRYRITPEGPGRRGGRFARGPAVESSRRRRIVRSRP